MARDGDRRKAEIAAAAFELIAEKGLEGFRVRDVATRAGVNIATLHYYFSTKEDLVRAVVEHMLSFFMTEGAAHSVIRELTAADELREEAKNLERQVREHPEMFVAMGEFTARARRDEGVRKMLAWMDYGWRSRLAAIVMRGHREASIRLDLDPYQAASILSSLMKGMCSQTVCGLDSPDFRVFAEEIGRWVSAKP